MTMKGEDTKNRASEREAREDPGGGNRHRKLTDWEKRGNRTRSKVRSRIEHVFGVQAMMAGDLLLSTIGIARAWVKIGLRNLAYNMFRFQTLATVR